MTKRLIDLLVEAADAAKTKHTILGIDVWVLPLTLATSSKAAAKHPNDVAMMHAENMVLCCMDAEGKPVFTTEDKPLLARRVPASLVNELVLAMNGKPAAEQEKNSETGDQ